MAVIKDRKTKWINTRLDVVCSRIYSGGTPSTKNKEYYNGNIPWLRTQEVNFNYIYNTDIKISEDGFNNSSAKWTPEDTVIVAMYGNSAGRSAFSKIPLTTNQACCNLIIDREKANPYFVYFALKNSYRRLEDLANGGAQQNLNVGIVKDFTIPLPELPEQNSIASVLSSLDNKIELLQDENKALEKIVSAIFNDWFTEKIANSEISEEWDMKRLSDVVDHLRETVSPQSEPQVQYAYYSIPAFDTDQQPALEVGSKIMSNKYRVLDETILLSKLNPNTPRIWAVFSSQPNSICSTEFQVLKPKRRAYFAFVYSLLSFSEFARDLAGKVQGTSSSHQRLRPEDILGMAFPFPDEKKVEFFSDTTYPILKKVDENRKEISTLVEMRDTLLPRLMSGELKVKYDR